MSNEIPVKDVKAEDMPGAVAYYIGIVKYGTCWSAMGTSRNKIEVEETLLNIETADDRKIICVILPV